MAENKSKVLYDNLLRNPAAFGTLSRNAGSSNCDIVSGFPIENMLDWRDFSFCKADDTGTTLVLEAVATADALSATAVCIYAVDLNTDDFTVEIEHEANIGGAVTSLHTFTFTTGGPNIQWADIGQLWALDDIVRITITKTAAQEIGLRQIAIGNHLEFMRGQYVGMVPSVNEGGVVRRNVISVNGSIIASNVKRLEKKDTIDIDRLEPVWVRSTLNPFIKHCVRFPFFRQWAPVDYPNEIDWCAAEKIESPTNAHTEGKMAWMCPLHCLTR